MPQVNDELMNSLASLEPVLSASAKKSLKSIFTIMEAYPGKSLPEIEKLIGSLRKLERTTIDGMITRAQQLCDGRSDESIDFFLKDLKSVNATDLKKIGKGLFIELNGKKEQVLAEMKIWIESNGEIKPKTAQEIDEEAAREFSSQVKMSMDRVTAENINQIVSLTEEAAKKLSTSGFKEFARQLNITVNGSKAGMKKQVINFAKSLAVSHAQTQF